MAAKPRLTQTVLFGLRSVFESCDLSHFRELYEGQPVEEQDAQLAAYRWILAMTDHRAEHGQTYYGLPSRPGRGA